MVSALQLEPLITVHDVASLFGVSEGTVYDWVSRQAIPCYKINGALRFRRSELERWMAESRRGPQAASA